MKRWIISEFCRNHLSGMFGIVVKELWKSMEKANIPKRYSQEHLLSHDTQQDFYDTTGVNIRIIMILLLIILLILLRLILLLLIIATTWKEKKSYRKLHFKANEISLTIFQSFKCSNIPECQGAAWGASENSGRVCRERSCCRSGGEVGAFR